MVLPRFEMPVEGVDVEEIGRRIVALAEIATVEHLEALMGSQAEEMLKLVCEADGV